MSLVAALIIDALLGEPPALWRRVPHPVVLFGRLIDALDARLNRGHTRRGAGVIALALLLVATVVPAVALAAVPDYGVLEILGAAILLAHRSLVEHVAAVSRGLRTSLADGRRAVSMIVGRDPQTLDEAGVARAAIESAAENFSDGVVAPAFWFAVGGLPGIVAYKAINTADSMIGHRTERFARFGWAAARLDDVMNLIPARLTGVLLGLAAWRVGALEVMWRDARQHRSPNAGWPEAAMAASLGVALAGPRVYGGEVVEDPYMNPEGRVEARADDIDRAIALLWRAWAVLVALALVLGLL